MKKIVTLATVVMLATGVQAADFTLTGTQTKDVTTSYYVGYLYDFSIAKILSGGSVLSLSAYDISTVDVSSGKVSNLWASDTSTVAISGGSVTKLYAYNLRQGSIGRVNITNGSVGTLTAGIDLAGSEYFSLTSALTLSDLTSYGVQAAAGTVGSVSLRLSAYDTSTVGISGGTVSDLYAYDTSTVDVAVSTVSNLYTYDTSTVDISGGSVGKLYAYNLRQGSIGRVNITTGSVGALNAGIDLVGSEHFSLTSALTLSDLAPYGVQAAAGTVTSVLLHTLDARNTSTVALSDGSVGYLLSAYDTSAVDVSGCNVSNLYAYDTSTVGVSGGSVVNFNAYNTSTVAVSGGNVDNLNAYHTSTVEVSSGSVKKLNACDTSTVGVSGGIVSSLYAYNTSSVDISGGSVSGFYALDTSVVDISGGTVVRLEARSTSTVDISGGAVYKLYAFDSSTITFLGTDFVLGEGLSLIGDELFGTGTLSGLWLDGTSWTTQINSNASTATILLVPEPATLLLLGVGWMALRWRSR